MSRVHLTVVLSLLLGVAYGPARAQTPIEPPPPTIDTRAEAGDAEAEPPARKLVPWNEYNDGKISTFRFGFGTLVDYAGYGQDDASKQQVAMDPDIAVRDFRLLFRGTFKTQRPLSWTLGYMWDGANETWRFRLTGIQVGFPEVGGNLFVGRTKEGYSMIKVMVGYHPWTMERSPALDAFVPILADGVKWSGYHKGPRLFYSAGFFDDELSESESFSTFDHQIVGRVGWQPILSDEDKKVLHVAVMRRDGHPDEGVITIRSKPEANLTNYFLDTGPIASDRARTTGVEWYYRQGPWLFGSEYNWEEVDAKSGEDPMFHAGDAAIAWLITGETRGYNAAGGFFKAVSPARTVFQGGPGAWEAVFHASYSDFDSGKYTGGKLWKLTPMVNWHMSDNIRLELAYGYSELDRFGLQGSTQFLQFRLQLSL